MDISEIYLAYAKSSEQSIDYRSFSLGYHAAINQTANTVSLWEYLRMRHPTVNALTAGEAKLLCIDYPLQAGWVEKHGENRISSGMVEKLNKIRQDRYAELARKNKSWKK